MANTQGKLGVHGGNLRHAQEKYGLAQHEILDFSANINPLGLPDSVRSALLSSLDNVVHYPDCEAKALKAAIGQYYTLPLEQIVVGNGAVEIIYLLIHYLRPKRVLMPAPTFSEYERAVCGVGGELIYFPLHIDDNFQIDVLEFTAALDQVEMCFLCNPNNPVGSVMSRSEVLGIVAAAAQKNITVVVDESFCDFIADSGDITVRHFVAQYPNLIVLHSLTKFYAIPGLRLGFAVMDEKLGRSIELAKDPWNVNSLAQAAGVVALQDKTYIEESIALIQEEKEFMFQQISQLPGVIVFPPSVNFVFFRLDHSGMNATSLADATAQHGILIRDCSSYPGLDTHYIRVAVKSREENLRLINILRKILG